MKKQAYNPFLPSYEYIPDGEPHVFGNRIYIYGSHDKFNGWRFCENDYVCWSAPIEDLSDWKYEGIIYKKNQDPINRRGFRTLFAPDMQKGQDGRYYLYYSLDFSGIISVAVCDAPTGKFEFYGHVHYLDGNLLGRKKGDNFQFDPAIFVDDDGRVFLYTGLGWEKNIWMNLYLKGREYLGGYCIELNGDMLTVKNRPKLIIPKKEIATGTSFEEHAFFEASSMRKMGEKYYFIYSSIHGHELCYAISDQPDGGFNYGGTIISNGDIFLNGRTEEKSVNYFGNNHGSIQKIGQQWYCFYHRQTNKHQFSRQACAERINIEKDGAIKQVEMTSCGLNGSPLMGKGEYEARIACNLFSSKGTLRYSVIKKQPLKGHPYFTQKGRDREENGNQYIAAMGDNSVAGFKYFDIQNLSSISVKVRGSAKGKMVVSSTMEGVPISEIPISPTINYTQFSGSAEITNGIYVLYFQFIGQGILDFNSFKLD